MPGTRRKLAARLLRTNWDAWNHPRRAKLLCPVFLLAGGFLSLLFQTLLAHRGYESLPGGAVTGVFSLGVLVAGLVVLALVD